MLRGETDNATALVEDKYDTIFTELIKQDTFYSNLPDNGPTISQLPAAQASTHFATTTKDHSLQ